jgi:hypothetical protein
MLKEMRKTELPESNNSPSPQETPRPTRSTSHIDNASSFTWKQTILEVSLKQGYTGIAL